MQLFIFFPDTVFVKKSKKNVLQILFFSLTIALLFSVDKVESAVCEQCGMKEVPTLVMVCPKCGKDMYFHEYSPKVSSSGILIIEIIYTGDNPERLPEYGKIFMNRKYRGNIELVEKEERDSIFSNFEAKGIGQEYTAVFRREFRDLMPGLYNIRIEMKFTRLGGIWQSIRYVEFPRFYVKPSDKSLLRHYFSSPKDFSQIKKNKSVVNKKDHIKIRQATGTCSLEYPLF